MSVRMALAVAGLAILSPAAVRGEDERLALGREVFLERAEPACPLCHTLAEAGAAGEIGPSLDSLAPTPEQVRLAVTHGVGPMRPYADLSKEEIEALAHYVASVARGG